MTYTTYLIIILLALISGLTTLIGVVLAYLFKKDIKAIVIGLGFSAGIMLLISFFELIPESINQIGAIKTLITVFFGALFAIILNLIIPHTHLIKEKGPFKNKLLKSAYLIAFGLILHDFPEGFAMANSYVNSPSLGLLVALSIALHNIPEEFAMAIPMVPLKEKRFIFKIAFFSGLAEPAGALLGLFAVSLLPKLNPFFISFAAGTMIFISLHELFPMVRRYKKPFLFVLGIVFSILIYLGLLLLIP